MVFSRLTFGGARRFVWVLEFCLPAPFKECSGTGELPPKREDAVSTETRAYSLLFSGSIAGRWTSILVLGRSPPLSEVEVDTIGRSLEEPGVTTNSRNGLGPRHEVHLLTCPYARFLNNLLSRLRRRRWARPHGGGRLKRCLDCVGIVDTELRVRNRAVILAEFFGMCSASTGVLCWSCSSPQCG